MSSTATDFLRDITPSDTPATAFKVNAHVHLPPNFSAWDTVADAVGDTSAQGVSVLGASNYYDFTVYGELARQAGAGGIFPLFGLEIITLREDLRERGIKINDPGNPGKMYLCGKAITAFDPMNEEAARLLGVIRSNDSTRMTEMVARLREHFNNAGIPTDLDADAIRTQVALRHGCRLDTVYLQERHVARAFQEVLFAVPRAERADRLNRVFGGASKAAPDDAGRVQADIRSLLMKAGKPAFVEETFVTPDHATRLILALGGIPSYPTLADGTSPICPFEEPVEELIAALKADGITCAEFIPVRNRADVLMRYVTAMRQAGLVITAGTEHNTPDRIPVAPTCLNGEPIPAEVEAIFREGACVLAAHQWLMACGEPGFVLGDGTPNPAYESDEERIAGFAELGAHVLAGYR